MNDLAADLLFIFLALGLTGTLILVFYSGLKKLIQGFLLPFKITWKILKIIIKILKKPF